MDVEQVADGAAGQAGEDLGLIVAVRDDERGYGDAGVDLLVLGHQRVPQPFGAGHRLVDPELDGHLFHCRCAASVVSCRWCGSRCAGGDQGADRCCGCHVHEVTSAHCALCHFASLLCMVKWKCRIDHHGQTIRITCVVLPTAVAACSEDLRETRWGTAGEDNTGSGWCQSVIWGWGGAPDCVDSGSVPRLAVFNPQMRGHVVNSASAGR